MTDNELFEALLELEVTEAELEAYLDDSEEQYFTNQLQLCKSILTTLPDTKSIKDLFLGDKIFVGLFGTDDTKWVENINARLAVGEQSDVEGMGMFLQDLAIWGPLGPLVTAFAGSLKRIKSRLQTTIENIDETSDEDFKAKLEETVTLQLPDYDKAAPTLKGMKDFHKLLIKIVIDPRKITVKQLSEELRKFGVETGQNPETATEWKVVVPNVIATALSFSISMWASIPLMIGMSIATNKLSKRGKSLAKRGWDSKEKIVSAMKDVIQLIDNLDDFKEAVLKLKSLNMKDLSSDQKKEMKAVFKMTKKAFSGYKSLLSMIGRGLAAI